MLDITPPLLHGALHQKAGLCGQSGGRHHHRHLRDLLLRHLVLLSVAGNIKSSSSSQIWKEISLLCQLVLSGGVAGDHSLLHGNLIPPQSVLVTRGKTDSHECNAPVDSVMCDVLPGHHDGDREGQDEDASDGAETADKLSQEGCRVHIIPNSCQRHQTPPERVIK